MIKKENRDLELPPKRETASIKGIRTQLGDLEDVEDTKIVSSSYGAALVSPPKNTTFKIAVFMKNGSAYLVSFSDQYGWEDVEEIEPSEYWDQHSLSTVFG